MLPASHLLYFENAVGQAREYADGYAGLHYKPGKRGFIEFQALLTHLGHLLHRRGWYKVLTDQRAMTPFTDEERAWIRERWINSPSTQREVITAVLLPEDVFARLSTNLVIHDAQQGSLTYHIFQDEEEAAAWLRRAA